MAGRTRPRLLSPSRWPVRWRLAGVSAGLTFMILLVFALVVGRLLQDRLRDDFRAESEASAQKIALSVSFDEFGRPGIRSGTAELLGRLFVPDAGDYLQFVFASGRPLHDVPADAPDLPAPTPGFQHFGDVDVATEQIPTQSLGPPVFVQYARTHDELDATIGRLWLFLGVGVAAGAIVATLAGLWVARRAMRPIASLTATAREIATTRDPSVTMPEPRADDEVAELARTLDSMLGELDAARTESQQMVQAQREFIADASHELRTPLTSILANLELLQERLESEPRVDDDAEMVMSALRSSRRMRRLVADLLMLARADAGRFGERRPCDLAEIAAAAVAEVRPVSDGHDLSLRADAAVEVDGNADELHRLAVNLLDNAVRHTPTGSTVEVAVERRGATAVLEVSDDGPGIPAGLEEQVFSRFVRGGGSADVVTDSSTGLGLAIVQAVAGSHGGEVEAGRSARGGARFTVRLPALPEPARTPTPLSAKL